MAKTAGAVSGDKDVILKTDATKVIVLFQLGVVDKVFPETLLLELFDKGRDEIDAGFIRYYMTGTQAACHAQ